MSRNGFTGQYVTLQAFYLWESTVNKVMNEWIYKWDLIELRVVLTALVSNKIRLQNAIDYLHSLKYIMI